MRIRQENRSVPQPSGNLSTKHLQHPGNLEPHIASLQICTAAIEIAQKQVYTGRCVLVEIIAEEKARE